MKTFLSLVVAAFVVMFIVMGSGCVDLAQVESMRTEAVKLREALREESKEWEGRVAALPPTDPLRADAEAFLAATRARHAAIDAAVLELDQVIKEARTPSDPLVSVTAPLLPEPLRSPYLLGAALVATLARGVQLKRGMASMARSLEKAMEDDSQLREGVKRQANTFRSIQTPTAQKIVNQVTGKGRPALALPI